MNFLFKPLLYGVSYKGFNAVNYRHMFTKMFSESGLKKLMHYSICPQDVRIYLREMLSNTTEIIHLLQLRGICPHIWFYSSAVCLSRICLSFLCLSALTCLFVFLSTCLTVWLSLWLSACLSFSNIQSLFFFQCLSLSLSSPPVSPSVWVSVSVFVCGSSISQ